MMRLWLQMALLVWIAPAAAEWQLLPPHDQRQPLPSVVPPDAQPIKTGDPWPTPDKFRWLVGDLVIPETIDGKRVAGKPVGLQFSCGDGGEIYVDGRLQVRYDNDHPALALIAEAAVPGTTVRVAVQVYARVQGGDKFDEAKWVLLDPKRIADRLTLKVNPQHVLGDVPDGIAGLSQGGGLSDYEDATGRKLRDGGFKWFRMDNVFTGVLKRSDDGLFTYDWADFDRRVDFIVDKVGADPIFAVSYMPQVLDAVPNNDRQSAPRDYHQWEELCYLAARRCLERNKRVPFWEVWNEVNTGWLKPGPEDAGRAPFRDIYKDAVGKPDTDEETVRRFEAYCKLYRATARGVLRADPKAKVGGPALASGPFESAQYGHCANGKGFARGLMLWCEREKLPLDFVSWHEYFHPAEVMTKEATAFREYLSDFPDLNRRVKSYMITEWNEAWWADRPQDHEIGAAYCADCIVRSFIPAKIDRPCFFYVKQGDMNFRGDYSMLMANNVPKASYNVLKIFNGLRGKWVELSGGDDDICGVAAWDTDRRRMAVVIVNFRYRHAVRRHVRLQIDSLPQPLLRGSWQEWVVDASRSNIWNDPQRPENAELTRAANGRLADGSFALDRTLGANTVVLIELLGGPRQE